MWACNYKVEHDEMLGIALIDTRRKVGKKGQRRLN